MTGLREPEVGKNLLVFEWRMWFAGQRREACEDRLEGVSLGTSRRKRQYAPGLLTTAR